MKKKQVIPAEITELRRKAEEHLSANSHHPPPRTETETLRLLHELQVHQIELEMQNAELLRARDAAEAARNEINLLFKQSKLMEIVLLDNQVLLNELNKSLEQRVSDSVEQLNSMDKMLMSHTRQAAMGEMISCIAHQWRQPLNVLGLNIQRLGVIHEIGGLDKEFLDKSINDSMRIINLMSHTISDFSDFFKPDKE